MPQGSYTTSLFQSGINRMAQKVPLPADGYPQLPVSEMDVHITLPASVLKHLIQMVHFAMAQQDVRFYLNGMLLVLDGKMVRKGNGKYMVDLLETNRQILTASGVKNENITVSDVCTNCNSDLLWSHRATKGHRGTMSAFMCIKED